MIIPQTKDAYRLLMDGEEALSHVSYNGFKVDVEYYKNQKPVIDNEIKRLHDEIIEQTTIGRAWKSRYYNKINIDSSTQLKVVLEKDIGFDKFKVTAKGGNSADKDVIAKLPYEFSGRYLKYKQLQTALGGLIHQIVMGADSTGFIHPNFNLHTVRTFRSSCDSPNLQQMPKHDAFVKKLVRTGFVTCSPDTRLFEIDLRGNEVSVGCCLHRDPQMLTFLNDKSADMHGTVADHFYRLNETTRTKELRSSVKGRFVFPSFYGAGSESIAISFWDYVSENEVLLGSGETLKAHMEAFGVVDFDSMLRHTTEELKWYWEDLFGGYNAWKEGVYNVYKEQGYLDLPTGFRVTDFMRKTQAMNVVIQGAAFHVLLAILIGLVRRMEHYKLKSKIRGQIHDSIVGEAYPEELQTIYNLYIDSQQAVRKKWGWLIYDIVAESELSGIGGNWAVMHEDGVVEKECVL